jgi:hypothetical protein
VAFPCGRGREYSLSSLLPLYPLCGLAELDTLWEGHCRSLRSSEEELGRSGFVRDYSFKQLYRIEALHGQWFEATNEWERQICCPFDSTSFNWPVYDLEIVDNSLVTVSGRFCATWMIIGLSGDRRLPPSL